MSWGQVLPVVTTLVAALASLLGVWWAAVRMLDRTIDSRLDARFAVLTMSINERFAEMAAQMATRKQLAEIRTEVAEIRTQGSETREQLAEVRGWMIGRGLAPDQ